MARKMPKKNTSNRVESIRHKDKRKNIPTEELRDFVAADENAPKKMLYPRDPSLDPQLVWKGKDEQDVEDLAVPVVNNHGGFGRWASTEIDDPWDAKRILSRSPHINHGKKARTAKRRDTIWH